MKTCTKCLVEKPLEQFDFRNKAKGTKRSLCKTCMALDHITRYATESRKKAIKENRYKRRQELLDKIWEYKSTHPCVDCGRTNPAGLEFDHLPEFIKEFNICDAVVRGMSWERVLLEINKCEVVCGYCHGIRTHERGGWKRNTTNAGIT